MLMVQSLPYTAAAVAAVISGLPRLPAWTVGRCAGMQEAAGQILAVTGAAVAELDTAGDRRPDPIGAGIAPLAFEPRTDRQPPSVTLN
jgi:hypothetical protein